MRRAEELRYLILAAQREGNRRLAHALRPLGVTPAQAEVIRLLAERQPLTLTGLGELLVCESGTNPSRLVDRLVTAGVLTRTEVRGDRRQVELTLTPEGVRLAGRIGAVEQRLYEEIDAAGAGHDLSSVIDYLRALVAGEPAGLAVARRAGARFRTDGEPAPGSGAGAVGPAPP